MRILQVLPALHSGGVERGTIEFARELVTRGHDSWVMSSGGRLSENLEATGSRHIRFPVHRKSLRSLLAVRALRKQLLELAPAVVHVRSRVPAWMVYLALRPLPANQRPAVVSTFHGLYSTNAYSAIMGRADRVIAISRCVRDYILSNYPKVPEERITVVPRGVDTRAFHGGMRAGPDWIEALCAAHPGLDPTLPWIMMPGRLSRWKGQATFIRLIASLRARGVPCQGLIVGEAEARKEAYATELQQQVAREQLQASVFFLGHRSDMATLYATCQLVCNLSSRPEPFGRTVIEALACGTPVLAWDQGGPAESLRDCLPEGLVMPGDEVALLATAQRLLTNRSLEFQLPDCYTLGAQADATLAVYEQALADRG